MTLTCPVCERSIEPDSEQRCPVCESDLSALVLYRQSRAGQAGVAEAPRPAGMRRYGWLLLLILLAPLLFFLGRQFAPRTPAAVHTVVVTATQAAAQSPTRTPSAAATHTATPSPSPTSTRAFTPTATRTATSLPPLTLESLADLNCRAGPGPGYPVVSYLPNARRLPVLAARDDGAWLMIPHPQQEGLACWVWAEGVTLTGALDTVPQIPPSR
jgi:hypothetical protein